MTKPDGHSLADLLIYPGQTEETIVASCGKCNWLESFDAPTLWGDIIKAHRKWLRLRARAMGDAKPRQWSHAQHRDG